MVTRRERVTKQLFRRDPRQPGVPDSGRLALCDRVLYRRPRSTGTAVSLRTRRHPRAGFASSIHTRARVYQRGSESTFISGAIRHHRVLAVVLLR